MLLRFIRTLVAGGIALSLGSLAFPQAPLPSAAETARLETIEDLSESLANDILDLSVAVRDRDLDRVGAFFADTVAAPPFPTSPRRAATAGPVGVAPRLGAPPPARTPRPATRRAGSSSLRSPPFSATSRRSRTCASR